MGYLRVNPNAKEELFQRFYLSPSSSILMNLGFRGFSNPSLHYVMSLWSNAPIIVPCIGEISFFARPLSSIRFVFEKHRSESEGNCILHTGLVKTIPIYPHSIKKLYPCLIPCKIISFLWVFG